MKEKLKNKKVIVVSSIILVMTIIVLLVITLKDSYAYYGGSNELEIMKATIGKLKPTIDKVFIESENQQYTNNPNPNVTITWSDDNITEYCVTLDSNCTEFTQLSDTDTSNKSVTAPITLSGERNHTVNAYIKNKYGYTSLAGQSSITLDTIAPTISNLKTTEIKETSVTISFEGNDTISGVSQYCYSTTGSNYICNDMVNGDKTFTISGLDGGKNYTLYIYLKDNAGNNSVTSQYTFTTISKSAKDVIVATSKSLESEKDLAARNEAIKSAGGQIQDDLRRFVGPYTTVNDNFICFGTTDQQTCKNNMDTYMYRIIGIDTQNRLKVIKATKVRKNSQIFFRWHYQYTVENWQNSDLYKGLNGLDWWRSDRDGRSCNQCFGNGSEYGYMQEAQWSDLIDKSAKYYIGDSISNISPTLFVNERTSSFNDSYAGVGLMNLSDYLYASNGTTDISNWLFIANGLNGAKNNGSGAIQPSAEEEWTITRYKRDSYGADYAWYVDNNGTVNNYEVRGANAVRPVFYLKPATQISEGNGQIGTPYMIA